MEVTFSLPTWWGGGLLFLRLGGAGLASPGEGLHLACIALSPCSASVRLPVSTARLGEKLERYHTAVQVGWLLQGADGSWPGWWAWPVPFTLESPWSVCFVPRDRNLSSPQALPAPSSLWLPRVLPASGTSLRRRWWAGAKQNQPLAGR